MVLQQFVPKVSQISSKLSNAFVFYNAFCEFAKRRIQSSILPKQKKN